MQSTRENDDVPLLGAKGAAFMGAITGFSVINAALLGVVNFGKLVKYSPVTAVQVAQAITFLAYLDECIPPCIRPSSYLGNSLSITSAGVVLDITAVGAATGLALYGLYSAANSACDAEEDTATPNQEQSADTPDEGSRLVQALKQATAEIAERQVVAAQFREYLQNEKNPGRDKAEQILAGIENEIEVLEDASDKIFLAMNELASDAPRKGL